MKINYILTKDFIKLNGKKVYLGESFKQISKKTSLKLFISSKERDLIIVSEDDYQLHFINQELVMWTAIPDQIVFTHALKRLKLKKFNFQQFIHFLNEKKIAWKFNKDLTFNDQVTLKLQNKNNFTFLFNKKHTAGTLSKIGNFNIN